MIVKIKASCLLIFLQSLIILLTVTLSQGPLDQSELSVPFQSNPIEGASYGGTPASLGN